MGDWIKYVPWMRNTKGGSVDKVTLLHESGRIEESQKGDSQSKADLGTPERKGSKRRMVV